MEDELCAICLSNINEKQNYKLECGHNFHTECILKWFRNSHNNCPCCLNIPKHRRQPTPPSFYGMWGKSFINERCKRLKKHTKKEVCPEKLKKKVDRLKIKEEEYKHLLTERNNIKKDETYKKINKRFGDINKKIYNKERTLMNMKIKIITDYPTIITS